METFVCRPERGGPFPAVFLLMDAPGIREELRDMARRLGTVGYSVVLPNLYYRAGRDTIYGPDVLEKDSAEHTRMRAVRTRVTIPPVNGRRRRNAGLRRSPSGGKAGTGRLPWLLYERPLRLGHRGALFRPHRRRCLLLRHLARQQRGGEPTSLIGQGKG